MTQKKYKICLVSQCLSTGGAERVAALLSNYFVKKGIDVYHVIVIDSVTYDYSGKLLNLGKQKNNSNTIFNKIKRFVILNNFIKEHDFDFIIDFRVKHNFFQEWLVSKIIYKPPTIYSVHSYMIDLYFSKKRWLARNTHSKTHVIVSITNKTEDRIYQQYGFTNVHTIYNPIDILEIEEKSQELIAFDFDYIVCAGSMNLDIKQFDKLIISFANSSLHTQNIKLVILGDGKNKNQYQKLSIDLNIANNVVFLGHVDNPYKYYKNARFFVLSSLHEGLPMVILESLASGTPVVSFDCLSGPSEMIVHNQNGILVDNQNFHELTKAMDMFISNQELYNYCKQNTKKSIQQFSLENIGKQWLDYLKIYVS